MDNLLQGLAKFFGHLPVSGVEAFLFPALKYEEGLEYGVPE
jgi:hypothetical protein